MKTILPTTHESHCSNSDLLVMPGDRVLVFDPRLFKNDVDTPLSMTMRPATIIRRYGRLQKRYSEDLELGPYADVVDVVFDHRNEKPSESHFTSGIQKLET
jgi:hypothetical protein